jgi:threonine/homoserine/homoserine lactone efflux protein
MAAAVGEVLPLAVGVAISPIPIIATILMLLSPKARLTSVGFLLGWIAGISIAVTAFTLLGTLLPTEQSDTARVISGVVRILLGVVLLLLGVKQWRSRPKWMSAVDSMTAPKAAGLALLLAAVNPKNLLLAASAGISLSAGEDRSSTAVAIVIFVIIAAATVAVPVLAYLLAASKMAGALESLRNWLVLNNSTIMSVLLTVIAATMIGQGIGAF